MDRVVSQVDETGAVVVDEAGEVIMVPNETRLSWIDATALATVLGMGILAYAFSAFALVVGVVLMGLGYVALQLRTTSAILV